MSERKPETLPIACDKCSHVYLSHQIAPTDHHCHCPVCGRNRVQMAYINRLPAEQIKALEQAEKLAAAQAG